MAHAAAHSRALGRGCTRVSVGCTIPFYLVPIQPGLPFPARSGVFGCSPSSPPCLSPRPPTCPASVKTQKTHSWLHSAARPASGFLQVAPIETASARASSPSPGLPVRGSPDRALTTSGAFAGAKGIYRQKTRGLRRSRNSGLSGSRPTLGSSLGPRDLAGTGWATFSERSLPWTLPMGRGFLDKECLISP